MPKKNKQSGKNTAGDSTGKAKDVIAESVAVPEPSEPVEKTEPSGKQENPVPQSGKSSISRECFRSFGVRLKQAFSDFADKHAKPVMRCIADYGKRIWQERRKTAYGIIAAVLVLVTGLIALFLIPEPVPVDYAAKTATRLSSLTGADFQVVSVTNSVSVFSVNSERFLCPDIRFSGTPDTFAGGKFQEVILDDAEIRCNGEWKASVLKKLQTIADVIHIQKIILKKVRLTGRPAGDIVLSGEIIPAGSNGTVTGSLKSLSGTESCDLSFRYEWETEKLSLSGITSLHTDTLRNFPQLPDFFGKVSGLLHFSGQAEVDFSVSAFPDCMKKTDFTIEPEHRQWKINQILPLAEKLTGRGFFQGIPMEFILTRLPEKNYELHVNSDPNDKAEGTFYAFEFDGWQIGDSHFRFDGIYDESWKRKTGTMTFGGNDITLKERNLSAGKMTGTDTGKKQYSVTLNDMTFAESGIVCSVPGFLYQSGPKSSVSGKDISFTLPDGSIKIENLVFQCSKANTEKNTFSLSVKGPFFASRIAGMVTRTGKYTYTFTGDNNAYPRCHLQGRYELGKLPEFILVFPRQTFRKKDGDYLAAFLPPLPDGSVLSGQTEVRLEYRDGKLSMNAELVDAALAIPKAEMSLTGMHIVCRKENILLSQTKPGCKFSFRKLKIGKYEWEDGKGAYRISPEGIFRLEKFSCGWCKGKMTIAPDDFIPGETVFTANCDRMDFAAFLTQLGPGIFAGEGMVSGKIDFSVSENGAMFQNAFFQSIPGENGTLKSSFPSTAMGIGTSADTQRFAFDMMENMKYAWVTFEMKPSENGKIGLTLHFNGKPGKELFYRYDPQRGMVKSDEAVQLPALLLDVDFKLDVPGADVSKLFLQKTAPESGADRQSR